MKIVGDRVAACQRLVSCSRSDDAIDCRAISGAVIRGFSYAGPLPRPGLAPPRQELSPNLLTAGGTMPGKAFISDLESSKR